MTIDNVSHLTHQELTNELGRLAGCAREATAALIVHLAEFDARRLYEPAGYPSLFKYCMDVLHLSEDAVYNRIEVARAVRRFPVLAEMLTTGALSPTTARMVVEHLTVENQEELLAAASFQSKAAVEELLAHRFPQPDVTARVRKTPSPRTTVVEVVYSPTDITTTPTGRPAADSIPGVAPPPAPATTAPANNRPVVRPRAPDRYEIRFTASKEMRDELREAQDLLGHAIPSGDIAAIFGRALTLLVGDLKKKKCAATSRPRPSAAPTVGSNVPAEVKRAVWSRDRASCAFVAADGRRCGGRRLLEFHHVVPRAAGGLGTVENIALRCRAHNGHEVDLFFGSGKRWVPADERARSGTSRHAHAGGREEGRRPSAGAG